MAYIDYYKINHSTKMVTICDLKTTSKTIADFKETVDFYNYWLQAAIYSKLVFANKWASNPNYMNPMDKSHKLNNMSTTSNRNGDWTCDRC